MAAQRQNGQQEDRHRFRPVRSARSRGRRARRSRASTRAIRPLSVSWSYPSRCSRPCSASTRHSVGSGCPASRACRRATPRAITMSPRKTGFGLRTTDFRPGNDKTSVAVSFAAVGAVQGADARVGDDRHRDIAGRGARRNPRRATRQARARASESPSRPRRSRGARDVGRSEAAMTALSGAAAVARLMCFVCFDDLLHELVPDDVAVVEVDEGDALDAGRRPSSPRRGRTALPVGRSICVMSPVTTALDPKPRRVRNIFICSDVVFCASSRMTNESFSVRPRMNASGAISTLPRSSSRSTRSTVEHVVERIVERPQVRVHLLLQVAGQEPELLAGLDRRPRQDDAAHLLLKQVRRRPAPSPDTSCPCRPDRCRRRCRAARSRRGSGAG